MLSEHQVAYRFVFGNILPTYTGGVQFLHQCVEILRIGGLDTQKNRAEAAGGFLEIFESDNVVFGTEQKKKILTL